MYMTLFSECWNKHAAVQSLKDLSSGQDSEDLSTTFWGNRWGEPR